jgi:hypothetical protein
MQKLEKSHLKQQISNNFLEFLTKSCGRGGGKCNDYRWLYFRVKQKSSQPPNRIIQK